MTVMHGAYNFFNPTVTPLHVQDWVKHKHKIAAVCHGGCDGQPENKNLAQILDVVCECNQKFKYEVNKFHAICILLRKQTLIIPLAQELLSIHKASDSTETKTPSTGRQSAFQVNKKILQEIVLPLETIPTKNKKRQILQTRSVI